MKIFPFFKNLMKATILYKFSDRMITSAALIFNYDLALILTPMSASCKQGMSFNPKYIKMYHLQPLLHSPFYFFGSFLSIYIYHQNYITNASFNS